MLTYSDNTFDNILDIIQSYRFLRLESKVTLTTTYLLSFSYQHRLVFPLVRTFYKDVFLSVEC